MKFVVDTHVLVWRLLQPSRLPKKVRHLFSEPDNEFLIPTVCLLEIQYLSEIGRIELDVEEALVAIREETNFQLIPYDEEAMLHSLKLTTTRDPFDRMILAHALSQSTKILTKDHWMKQTAPHLAIF